MNTPPNVLRMLAAIRDEGHNLQKEDPHDMLEKAYNLGYEEESMGSMSGRKESTLQAI